MTNADDVRALVRRSAANQDQPAASDSPSRVVLFAISLGAALVLANFSSSRSPSPPSTATLAGGGGGFTPNSFAPPPWLNQMADKNFVLTHKPPLRKAPASSENVAPPKRLADYELNSFEEEGLSFGTATGQRGAISVTRCSTTQFAMTNFLCGEDVAVYGVPPIGGGGVTAFRSWLQAGDGRLPSNVVLRCHLGQRKDHMGHTWLIVGNVDGTGFRWLQSYIGQYTLRDWLGGHVDAAKVLGGDAFGADLNNTQLPHMLDQIAALEHTTRWDQPADDTYAALFGVSPMMLRNGMYAGTVMGEKERLAFDFELGCQHGQASDANKAELKGEAKKSSAKKAEKKAQKKAKSKKTKDSNNKKTKKKKKKRS